MLSNNRGEWLHKCMYLFTCWINRLHIFKLFWSCYFNFDRFLFWDSFGILDWVSSSWCSWCLYGLNWHVYLFYSEQWNKYYFGEKAEEAPSDCNPVTLSDFNKVFNLVWTIHFLLLTLNVSIRKSMSMSRFIEIWSHISMKVQWMHIWL